MSRLLEVCTILTVVLGVRTPAAADAPADAQRPANRTAAMTETDARLKAQLRGQAAEGDASPSGELLERAAELMRSASDRLQDGQTGQATRTAQQQAVAALDELIQRLEQPPPPNESGSPPPPDSQPNPPPSPQDASRKPMPPPEQQPQEQPDQSQQGEQRQPGGKPQDREQAEDSEEQKRERQRREAAELKRRKLQTDVWGHLPEHLREQLLNTYGERMLPKYEDLVRRFYDRLSETPAKKSSR